jgi:hypothetical protein
MKKLSIILLISLIQNLITIAQPIIAWQKCLGGSKTDRPAYSQLNYQPHQDIIQQTSDSGFIIACISNSTDGDVTGFHSYMDSWIIKTDKNGNIQWEKCLGGTEYDEATCVEQTSDGGFIVGCNTRSNDGDVPLSSFSGWFDYWVVKLSSTGNIQWSKRYGGTEEDQMYSIKQSLDGGYVLAGNSRSTNGDVTGLHGFNYDYWVVKIDSSGNIEWEKCLGGNAVDKAYSISLSSDSGFVVAGQVNSNNGDVTGFYGIIDYWIVKLDKNGIIVWQKCFGGSKIDIPKSISSTTDGGYIIAGITTSHDGDVIGRYDTIHAVSWVVKIDSIGILQWQKCFHGNAESAIQTQDGGYLISGALFQNDSTSFPNSITYYYMIKLDDNYNFQWHSCDGPSSGGNCDAAIQTLDGKYALIGHVFGNGGNVSGIHTGFGADVWLVKFSELYVTKSTISDICSHCQGAISLNIFGGSPPYVISWNTGASTNSISNLCSGTYIATINDASGNSGFLTGIINNDTVLVTASSLSPTCLSCTDGSATLNPYGGSGVYHYSWQGFPDTTATLSGLPHGWVYGCVTDSLGCVACVHINVASLVGIEEFNTMNDLNIFPNPAGTFIQITIDKLNLNINEIKLFDIYGHHLPFDFEISASKQKAEINLNGLSSGIYIIQISCSGKILKRKFIKY